MNIKLMNNYELKLWRETQILFLSAAFMTSIYIELWGESRRETETSWYYSTLRTNLIMHRNYELKIWGVRNTVLLNFLTTIFNIKTMGKKTKITRYKQLSRQIPGYRRLCETMEKQKSKVLKFLSKYFLYSTKWLKIMR